MKKILKKFDELHVGNNPDEAAPQFTRRRRSSGIPLSDEEPEELSLPSTTGRSYQQRRTAPLDSIGTTDATGNNQFDHDNRIAIPSSSGTPSTPHGSRGADQDLSTDSVIARSKFDSEDITRDTTVAPAVQHERITEHVRYIREEYITREVHDHDIHHRILPIKDIEILPARHFLPLDNGQLIEVPANAVPGRARHWNLSQGSLSGGQDMNLSSTRAAIDATGALSSHSPDLTGQREPKATDPKSDATVWVHPPILETGAERTGQTQPLVIRQKDLGPL